MPIVALKIFGGKGETRIAGQKRWYPKSSLGLGKLEHDGWLKGRSKKKKEIENPRERKQNGY